MEGGDNILRVSSARLSSSNIWRNSGGEVFSKSFCDEHDEEALKWAAMEKLPTYQRIQRGILTEEQGHAREIDIKKLGVIERKNLLERLVKIAEDDNEKFLLKLKKRIDRVRIDLPTIEVWFEHLNVDAEAYVGGRGFPTVLNFSINLFERKKPLSILHDVSGILKPGRMTLLLGPPSAGKTSLLLALGGKLDSDLKVSGKVTYNGHGMNEFVPQRTSTYISQHDLHIGELTVKETLAFSARCQGVGARYDMLTELARREKEANIKPDPDLDIFMKAVSQEGQRASVVTDYILGLEVCADTMGNEMVRGISGGQKKRVTTGETLVGPARVLFMDKISTGLDSSTTYQIVNSIKQSIHILQGTTVISLLQPTPELMTFFEYMGFKCLEKKGVTSKKDQEQYWLAIPFDKAKSHPAALTTKNYGVSKKELLKALISREYLLMKRNSFVYIFKFTQLIIMAFIAMTIFLRTEMPKKTTIDGTLSTFYKQRDLLFFPAWAYSLPQWILKIPITFVEVGRNIIVANTFGSFTLLGVLVLGGFILSREYKEMMDMGYWASPLMYAQNAIAVNEFLGSSWRHVLVNSTESLGTIVLKSCGIFPEAYWYWIGVRASIGYIFLFNSLFTLAFAYLNSFGKPRAALAEETMAERNACKIGEIELSSRGKRPSFRGDEVQRSTSSTSVTSRVDNISEVGQNRKHGMVLLFEPLSITFDDVRYVVDMPQEMKAQGILEDRLELLKGVSGAFRPGVLTALMGVSGARKTTLMDVLAGRKIGRYIEGRITISGYAKKQETFARVARYCEQTDIHSLHVTVYESLQYSAWLRLPLDVDSASKKMFADEVMELVELTPLKEALVWLPEVNGLSTEQRKRLTIAVELVANLSIIFMDEPTLGLDTRATSIVMRTVRNTLFLLKRGGEEIYVSPLGCHAAHLIENFEGINGISKIKDAALGVNFAEVYKNSDLYRKDCSNTFFIQCMACLWKQHLSCWRNPPYSAVRFLFTTCIALLFGTIFWDLGSKREAQQDIFNAMGSMYAAVLFLGIQNAGSVQPVVAIERTVFYKERAAGMYSVLSYAFGQSSHTFLFRLSYGVIVYAMIRFEWTVAKFLWYLFFMYSTLLHYTFYGMMTVAVTPNQNIASIVSVAFYSTWNLFSGFIIPKTRIPVWWRWCYYICPVAWTLYGLVASQFGDIQGTLDTSETVEEFARNYFDFKHDFVGYVAIIIAGIAILFGFIFAYSIRVFNFQKR
ncbi:unnamed protein product [Camellia sinensis]